MKGLDRLKGDPRIKDHWKGRGAAFIVDYAIIFFVNIIISFIVSFIIITMLFSELGPITDTEGGMSFIEIIMLIFWIMAIVTFTFTVLYWVVLDARGGTFGKRVLKFKVAAIEGKMSYKKAAKRNLSKIIGAVFVLFLGIIFGSLILALILFLDVILGLSREGDPRQRYFDLKAGTRVERTMVAEDFGGVPVPMPVPMPVPGTATPLAGTPIPTPSTGEVQAQETQGGAQAEEMELGEEPVSEVPTSPPPSKGRRFPASPVIMVIVIVAVIIIAALAATLMFGGEEGKKEGTQNEMYTEPTQWEDMETIEGDITGGGPLTVMPDERVPFEVEETVYQMDIILSWNPQSQDLDLAIEDPSGSEAASSGNAPGETESVRIKGSIEPGTWIAVIDPFFAANVHYSLEITYYHESGNDTGEGELLYQKTMSLTGESGEEHDEFEVGAEYENLFIQVEIASSEGTINMAIMDPDGNEVYSVEASGEDTVSSQETVDAKEGTWTVDYSYEAFTGTVVVQVMGS